MSLKNLFGEVLFNTKLFWTLIKDKTLYQIRFILTFESNYRALREPKVKIYKRAVPQSYEKLIQDLRDSKFDLQPFNIDVGEYWEFVRQGQYSIPQRLSYKNGFIEKSLENFLAAKFLQLSPDDTFIDIASLYSPTPEIYSRLYGCKSYRQDLIFPPGIQGNTIGGNAARLPVPDGFASKMSLQCSFEHFEKSSDIDFIKEAGRVLRPGGKICILPLYLSQQYLIATDPAVLTKEDLDFEKGALVYCVKGYQQKHGRLYDVPQLISRIINNLGPLTFKLYIVNNAQEVDPSCYVKFIAILEKG